MMSKASFRARFQSRTPVAAFRLPATRRYYSVTLGSDSGGTVKERYSEHRL
jgi:hypothetical protein